MPHKNPTVIRRAGGAPASIGGIAGHGAYFIVDEDEAGGQTPEEKIKQHIDIGLHEDIFCILATIQDEYAENEHDKFGIIEGWAGRNKTRVYVYNIKTSDELDDIVHINSKDEIYSGTPNIINIADIEKIQLINDPDELEEELMHLPLEYTSNFDKHLSEHFRRLIDQ